MNTRKTPSRQTRGEERGAMIAASLPLVDWHQSIILIEKATFDWCKRNSKVASNGKKYPKQPKQSIETAGAIIRLFNEKLAKKIALILEANPSGKEAAQYLEDLRNGPSISVRTNCHEIQQRIRVSCKKTSYNHIVRLMEIGGDTEAGAIILRRTPIGFQNKNQDIITQGWKQDFILHLNHSYLSKRYSLNVDKDNSNGNSRLLEVFLNRLETSFLKHDSGQNYRLSDIEKRTDNTVNNHSVDVDNASADAETGVSQRIATNSHSIEGGGAGGADKNQGSPIPSNHETGRKREVKAPNETVKLIWEAIDVREDLTQKEKFDLKSKIYTSWMEGKLQPNPVGKLPKPTGKALLHGEKLRQYNEDVSYHQASKEPTYEFAKMDATTAAATLLWKQLRAAYGDAYHLNEDKEKMAIEMLGQFIKRETAEAEISFAEAKAKLGPLKETNPNKYQEIVKKLPKPLETAQALLSRAISRATEYARKKGYTLYHPTGTGEGGLAYLSLGNIGFGLEKPLAWAKDEARKAKSNAEKLQDWNGMMDMLAVITGNVRKTYTEKGILAASHAMKNGWGRFHYHLDKTSMPQKNKDRLKMQFKEAVAWLVPEVHKLEKDKREKVFYWGKYNPSPEYH